MKEKCIFCDLKHWVCSIGCKILIKERQHSLGLYQIKYIDQKKRFENLQKGIKNI